MNNALLKLTIDRRNQYIIDLHQLDNEIPISSFAAAMAVRIPDLLLGKSAEKPYVTLTLNHKTIDFNGKAKILIDDNIAEILRQIDVYDITGPQNFRLYMSGDEKVTDLDIVKTHNISKLMQVSQAVACALYLIAMDIEKGGALYEISQHGHENINIGYCDLKDQTSTMLPHVVYVEKPKRFDEAQVREYHIHSSVFPRPYKPKRFLLVPAE